MYCIENLSGMLCVADEDSFLACFFEFIIEAAAALEAESEDNGICVDLVLTLLAVGNKNAVVKNFVKLGCGNNVHMQRFFRCMR